ncbi:hypothetical protein HF1_02880 [Mycoplasma haemofelis str. Langford 1]|uniref:Uncharacterized protein n=1 Tax=Mycoplasma haemofelis (strain Langford 1) TaxID=941640 RepID=E8ZGM5_MYCHL|nr:hypothetical protein [Mycoplasma haemofelis]CBY92296.1 hypothetical protein HF1_02880 [Mycoplasma haemofelis str. Langford 1]
MSLSTLVKGTVGAGAVGTTVAGAAYAGGFFDKESKTEAVSSLLKIFNPNKRFITTSEGSDSHWKANWDQYKKDKDIWKLKDRNKSSSSDENAPSYFISECQTRRSSQVSGAESDLYKEVLRYCTRDTLVKDLISENATGRRLLLSSDDKTIWQPVWDDYKTKYANSADAWSLEQWDTKKSESDVPEVFKQACSKKSEEPSFKVGDEKYQNVLTWCTTDKK